MRLGEVMARASAFATIALHAAVARAADPPPPPVLPLPPVSEARPPPPPEAPPAPVPWHEHIEVGGGAAFTQMIASGGGPPASSTPQPKPMRFQPGVGFHIDLSWQVFRYLRFTGYMIEHWDPLDIPSGALARDSHNVPASFTGPSLHAYSFGVRASPTLPIGARVRLWLTAGAGWGYLGYGTFTQVGTLDGALNTSPVIRDRSSTIFEIPFGLGAAIEIIPRWLSFHAEALCAFAPSQVGEALQPGQYVDARGFAGTVYPMPQVGASFVETLGLSLHL